jgi:basic membrane protein A
MSSFAPEAYLTGTVWDWCNIYKGYVDAVREGTFEAGEVYGGLHDGTVSLAPYGPAVPEDVAATADAARDQLIADELDYWAGPLSDNQGNEVVPEGGSLTIDDINGMNWLVDGVDGEIPA